MNCPICNNQVLDEVNQSFYRCNKCEVLFKKDFLQADTKNLISVIYDANWVSTRQNCFDETISRHALYYEMILRFLKPTRGELLEIGSGTGEFLFAAKSSGWKVTGFEPSVASYNFIKNNLNVEIINSTWDKEKVLGRKFDVIFAAHVLEHLNEPVKFLNEIKSYLKSEGIVVLSMPNAKDIETQNKEINTGLYTEKDHLIFYNNKSLRYLAEVCGYSIEVMTTRQTAGENSRLNSEPKSKQNIERLILDEVNFKAFEIIVVLKLN